MKAGYENMKIYQNSNGDYFSTSGDGKMSDDRLVHHLSFVDCPGHQHLTQIMLGQVNLVYGAITVISMSENVSTNSQLIEHLKAAKLAGIDKNIVCLNKCDLVTRDVVISKYDQVLELFQSLGLSPPLNIIPTSFNKKLNINYLLESIMRSFPVDGLTDQSDKKPFFSVSRSFDINRPGNSILDLEGGVVGGTLLEGVLNVGDRIIIKPGRGGNCIRTKIVSIMSGKTPLDTISPGGLVAIKTDINPHFTRDNALAGNVICLDDDDSLSVINRLDVVINFIDDSITLKKDDIVKIQIGPKSYQGKISFIKKKNKKKHYSIELLKERDKPDYACLKSDTKLYISTNDSNMKIIGFCIFN